MLSVKTNEGYRQILNRNNFNIVYEYEGEQTLSFDLFPKDEVYKNIVEGAKLLYGDNRYNITKINERTKMSTINASLDMNDWKKRLHIAFDTVNKPFYDVIALILPEGWTVENKSSAKGRRAIHLEGVTDYDVLMACKKKYGVVYEYHISRKCIKVIDPSVIQQRGLYLMSELNLNSVEYKGDYSLFANRLYAFGKKTVEEKEDGSTEISYVNFASINGNKNYVDCMDYIDDEVVCAFWQDDRYLDAESLLLDAKEKVKSLAFPVRSWNCDIYDLSRTNPEYKMLDFKLYDKPVLITNNRKIVHQIVQYTEFPDDPNRNKVVLSTAFKKIQGKIQIINDEISRIDTDIKVSETLINKIERDVKSNTLSIKNTYTKGEVDYIKESIIKQTDEDIELVRKDTEIRVEQIAKRVIATYESSEFGYSSREDTEPTEWLEELPTVPEKHFLWMRDKYSYSDGTIGYDGARVISIQNSADRKGIEDVVLYYAINDSSTEAPTEEWSNNIPAHASIHYLWGKEKVIYTDGTEMFTVPILKTSVKKDEPVKVGGKNLIKNSKTMIHQDYKIKTPKPKSGLFDDDGNLIASWNNLVTVHGLDITKDYDKTTYATDPASAYNVFNKPELSAGTTLVIDSSITNLGAHSFRGCALENVIMNDNITSVGKSAFYQHNTLKKVVLSKKLTTLPNSVFGMSGLETIEIPGNIRTVEDNAFRSCRNLSNLTIKNGVETFGNNVFYDCHGLINVVFPKSVKTIGEFLFGCTTGDSQDRLLQSVDMSACELTDASNTKAMFQYRRGLKSFKPPKKFPVHDFTFNHAGWGSTEFFIPADMKVIGTSHMWYDFHTIAFKRFIVEDGNPTCKAVGGVLYSKDGTRLISVPANIEVQNETLELQEGVNELGLMNFGMLKTAKNLLLPNSFQSVFNDEHKSLPNSIYVYTSIENYKVKPDNPYYSEYEGYLYSKDGKQLLETPINHKGVVNIKPGCTTITSNAFWCNGVATYLNNNLTQINIPASVIEITDYNLTQINNATSVIKNIDAANPKYKVLNNKIVLK